MDCVYIAMPLDVTSRMDRLLVQVSYGVHNLPHDTQLMSTHDNPSPLTHALSKAITDTPTKNKVTKGKNKT